MKVLPVSNTFLNHFKGRKGISFLRENDKIKTYNPVCFFGSEEAPEIRKRFTESDIKTVEIPGSHHYNNDYTKIAEIILKEMKL